MAVLVNRTVLVETGWEITHRGVAIVVGLNHHPGEEIVGGGEILPRTRETVVALVLHRGTGTGLGAVNGAVAEHVAPLGSAGGRGCCDDAARSLHDEFALVVELVAATADVVDGTLDAAVVKVGALARNLCVLLRLHADVLHNRLVAAINGYAHTLARGLPIVQVVAGCQVLQVEALAVADVQDGVRNACAGAVDEYAVTALADQRDVAAIDALLVVLAVVLPSALMAAVNS